MSGGAPSFLYTARMAEREDVRIEASWKEALKEEWGQDYLKSLEINKEDIETYLQLAGIYCNLENYQQAFLIAEQAGLIEPNNPRVLDFLIKISIIVQDKEAALRAYKQLKEVNPENQKLSEIKEKISQL